MNRVLLFYLLISACLFSCKDEEEHLPRKVEYSMGCADCEVIYYTSGKQEVTEFDKNSNWTYSFDAQAGDVVMLVAYNTGDAPQGVTARIKLNDVVLEERTTYCPISGFSMVIDTLQ